MTNFIQQILTSKINQLETDAARWAYVRDHLAQGMDPRMDGTFTFRFRSPHGRAAHITELIDDLRNEINET
jgi:hypothetical protein